MEDETDLGLQDTQEPDHSELWDMEGGGAEPAAAGGAPNFIPAGQEPWAAAAAPDFIPEGKEPWAAAAAPDFIPEGKEPWATAPESQGGSMLRAAAHAVVPALGSLPAMGWGAAQGAAMGAPFGPIGAGVGTVIGGTLAAMGAGYVLDNIQETVLNKMGLNDAPQRAANEAEYPKSTFAAGLAPNLIAFRPGKLTEDIASRLLNAGLMGGLEAGTELAHGEFDTAKVGMATGFGAFANKATRAGEIGMGIGTRLPVYRPGKARAEAGEPGVQEDMQAAASSEPVKTGVGNAQAQPKPAEHENIGNPDSAPVGSERVYSNREARRARAAERIAAEESEIVQPVDDPVPADMRAALAPDEKTVVEPPAGQAPQPEAAPVSPPTRPEPPTPERQRLLPSIAEEHALDVAAATRQGVERAQGPRPDQVGELHQPEAARFDQPNPHADRVPERPLNARPEAPAPVEAPVREQAPVHPPAETLNQPMQIEPPVNQPPVNQPRVPRILEDLTQIRPEPVPTAEKISPQPDHRATVDRAIEFAKSLDQTNETNQKMLRVLEAARENPKKAEIVAKRFLDQYASYEKAKARENPEPKPAEAVTTSAPSESAAPATKVKVAEPRTEKSIVDYDGRVIGRSDSVFDANRKSASLKLARELMEKHAFPETDIHSPTQVKAARAKAKEILTEAEERGYKHYLPKERKTTDGGPKEHTEAPPHMLWMAEVKKFALGKRKPEDFITREKLLRTGDEESADIVRSDRRAAGDEFYRPHRGEAGEVTGEGNIAPKNSAEQKPVFGKRRSSGDEAPAGSEDFRAAVFAGPHVNVKVEPARTMSLRDALHPDEQMFIGGEFMEHHETVAKAILAIEPNVPVHVISEKAMARIYKDDPYMGVPNGFYDFVHHAIFLKEGAPRNTLLHEGIHAAMGRKIDNDPAFAKRIKDLMEAADSLKSMHPEAFANEHEFIAYGMTEPSFQSALARTRLSPAVVKKLGLGERVRNVWDAFLARASEVMGLGKEHMSALEGVIKLADEGFTKPGLTQEQTKGYRDEQSKPVKRLRAEQVQGVRDQADGLLKQLKGAVLLKLRDSDKIAQSADRVFGGADNNPIRKVTDHTEMARKRSLELAEGWDPVLETGLDLKAKDPDGYHDLQRLMTDESTYQRYGDLPLNQHPYSTKGINEEFKNAQHPDLEARWNALSDELKQHRDDLYDRFDKEHDALAEQTAASRLLKELDLDDPALSKRVMDGTLTAADFQRLGPDDLTRQGTMEIIQDAAAIGKLQGPYSPAMRRGEHVVTGQFKVPGTDLALRESVPHRAWEFDTKQGAIDFALKQEGRPHIDSYYVDATTGERTSKVTEPVKNSEGQDGTEPGSGRALTHDRDVPFSKNDPNTVQRWQVRVDRDYMKMLDTRRDALAHEKEIRKSGSFDKTDAQPKKYKPHTDAVTLASNLTNLEAKLKNNALYENMTPKQKETVKQLLAEHYLQMSSATRVHNSKLHRNFVKGADDDILRNTMDWAGEASDRRARMEHQPHIDAALKKAGDMVNEDTVHSYARRAILNEITSRQDAMKGGGFRLASGQMGPAQQRMMAWSYTARLATPGFTIRNLTQPWLMSLPEIGADHGWGATGRELFKLYRDIGGGHILAQGAKDTGRAFKGKLKHPETMLDDILQRPNITADDKFAIEYMVKRGRIDPDAGFQMGETIRRPEGIKLDFDMFGMKEAARKDTVLTRGIEGGLNKLDTGLHWIEEVSRQMPRAAETINRVVSGLAAFRLEMKKNGGDREKAARYADDAVRNTQFVYSDTNKPTWQRNPFARAAFQFKQFGKSTYEFLGRHIARSIDSQATPAERSSSRKALGGLFVTHTLVAGALGLPWEPVRALLLGAKQVGWTNKEWDDVENGIREGFTGFGNMAGLNEKNSKLLGETLSRGLPRLAGIDLSPGLGLDNMLLFGSPRSGTDREMDNNLSAWMFNMIAGAPTALQMQMLSGVRDLHHGEYAKGIEKLMPAKIASDTIKAGVGLAEGKKNTRGRETSPPYTPIQAGLKVLGLPNANEAERNTYQHQVYQQATEERTEKAKIIADWLKADSPGAKDKASQKAFDAGIKPVELTQALQRMRSEERRVVDGVATTKQSRPIADRLRKVYNFTQEE